MIPKLAGGGKIQSWNLQVGVHMVFPWSILGLKRWFIATKTTTFSESPGRQLSDNVYIRGVDVVEMGQIKVFVQELWLKQEFLADTNMDYITSEWPGTRNFKVDANSDMFPQNYG